MASDRIDISTEIVQHRPADDLFDDTLSFFRHITSFFNQTKGQFEDVETVTSKLWQGTNFHRLRCSQV